jgi:hypothetical protein
MIGGWCLGGKTTTHDNDTNAMMFQQGNITSNNTIGVQDTGTKEDSVDSFCSNEVLRNFFDVLH